MLISTVEGGSNLWLLCM